MAPTSPLKFGSHPITAQIAAAGIEEGTITGQGEGPQYGVW